MGLKWHRQDREAVLAALRRGERPDMATTMACGPLDELLALHEELGNFSVCDEFEVARERAGIADGLLLRTLASLPFVTEPSLSGAAGALFREPALLLQLGWPPVQIREGDNRRHRHPAGRQRPADLFFDLAKQRRVGILARVPLASGLLTGKLTRQSTFPPDDHRNFNRHGEAFDVGETFAGVDFELGLRAVERLRPLVPAGATLAQFALRWILMFDAVSCVIPGAKNRQQALDNVRAAELPALSQAVLAQVRQIYDELVREQVHQRW